MIEILIIVAIMALISVVLMGAFTRQMSRARDAQRKDHLEEMRVAFEDYYNDNQCYPDLTILSQCGSRELAPYLKEIQCDPLDKEPYAAFSLRGDSCRGYRVLTRLENREDPNIASMGCDSINGCYYEDPAYNFGIAMGDVATGEDWESVGTWVIGVNGVCVQYTDEALEGGGCPSVYGSYAQCFAVSGCTGNCSNEDVPLYLRCAN